MNALVEGRSQSPPPVPGLLAPGSAFGVGRESPERPAGAQRAHSGRAAGGSTDRFRSPRCGLLLHELWPRSRARRIALCAYGCSVNSKARPAQESL